MRHSYIGILLILLSITISCSDTIGEVDDALTFNLRVTNLLGERQSIFNEGESIIFRFEVKNNTDDQILFSQFKNEDFFLLKTSDNVNLGYPYINYFCEYIGAIVILPNSTYSISIPWDAVDWAVGTTFFTGDICGVPGNDSLLSGNYTTAFKQSFTYQINGESYKTEELNFNETFEVK